MIAFLLQTTTGETTVPPQVVEMSPEQYEALVSQMQGMAYFVAGVICVLVVGIGGLLFVSMMGGR